MKKLKNLMDRPEQARNGIHIIGQALRAICLVVSAYGCLLFVGCGKSETEGANKNENTPNENIPTAAPQRDDSQQAAALRLVEEMVAAYRKTDSYSDQGQLTLTTRDSSGESTRTLDCSIALTRPNQFRIQIRGTTIVSNGQHLWARLPKESVARNQILQRVAPRALSVDALCRPSFYDPSKPSLLADALTSGFGSEPFQLQLLATDRSIDPLLGADRIRQLASQSVHGQTCVGIRFEFDSTDKDIVLWIDPQQKLLRRLVFPDTIMGEAGQQIRYSLTADFHDAAFGQPIDPRAFELAIEASERRVKDFVPAPPAAPLQLLGKPLGNLALVKPDGKRIDIGQLRGKVFVFVFFATDDPQSLGHLSQLMAVSGLLKSPEKVEVIAVSTDPASLPDEQLQQRVGPLLHGGTLYRALQIRTDNTIGIQTLPTTLVVNPRGVVEYLLPGYFFEEATEHLRRVVDQIVAGRSMHRQVREQYDLERQRYQIQLLGVSAIAEKKGPQRLVLTPLWKSSEAINPGNLLIIEQPDRNPRIILLEDGRQIVELDGHGKVVANRSLVLPDGAHVSFLRSAVDGQGRRFFAASAPLQRQVHLFDENFRLLVSFPQDEQALVGDVQFADLKGDGALTLVVGYDGFAGTHMVSLDGKSIWRNTSAILIKHLAVLNGTAQRPGVILSATTNQLIVPIDADARGLPQWKNELGSPLSFAMSDRQRDGTRDFCMMAMTALGETVLGGMRYGSGRATWAFQLPAGIPEYPVEQIVWGHLVEDGDSGQWIVAAGDGSVNLFTRTGDLIDRFNTGREISGIAVTQIDNRPVLLIASADGVEALSVAVKR